MPAPDRPRRPRTPRSPPTAVYGPPRRPRVPRPPAIRRFPVAPPAEGLPVVVDGAVRRTLPATTTPIPRRPRSGLRPRIRVSAASRRQSPRRSCGGFNVPFLMCLGLHSGHSPRRRRRRCSESPRGRGVAPFRGQGRAPKGNITPGYRPHRDTDRAFKSPVSSRLSPAAYPARHRPRKAVRFSRPTAVDISQDPGNGIDLLERIAGARTPAATGFSSPVCGAPEAGDDRPGSPRMPACGRSIGFRDD